MADECNSNELSIKNFASVCRLCTAKMETLNLIENLHLSLLKILKNIIAVNIEPGDKLPNKVCGECISKLEFTSSFFDLCIKSDTKLRDILEKHENYLNSSNEDLSSHFSSFEGDLENNCKPVKDILNIKKPEEIDNCERLPEQENTQNKLIGPLTKRQPLDCEVCGQHFETRTKLQEHIKENVSCRTKQYKCTNCDKRFSTNFKLKLHMRSHNKEAPYECKICLKNFKFSSNVSRHINVAHRGLKPFKCDVCGKGFTRNSTLTEHKRDHSGEYPFVCNYCGLSFKKSKPYNYHLNLHKASDTESNSAMVCSICNRKFGSLASLKKHNITHSIENHFLCDICGKNFKTNQTLANHINIHMGEKLYNCEFCDRTFSRKSTLKVHCLSHTKEKPFKCKTCLKTFAQLVHLKNHERIHNGEKPYQCTFCSRKFSVKCNLVIHTRIHTKDTKYKCTVCGKMYYESKSLKKHMKIHQDSSLIVLTNEDISTLLS